MKLVTFQSMESLRSLINKGYLICDEKFIDKEKAGVVYDWIVSKMKMQVENNTNAKYPIWAWVKCYNSICPPKHTGKRIEGFDVKITFNKDENDVFITDYRRYSFLLNNTYIPDDLKDKIRFDEKIKKYNISEDDLRAFIRKDRYKAHRTDKEYIEICRQISQSFDKCITKNSDLLQGCVWSINLNEIGSIEILNDDNCIYGSLNYKRANGKRMNWIQDFYKKLL